MACNCYFEARGEGAAGMLAVNIVVNARTNSEKFPNTVCGVVYQRSQFSWTGDSNSNSLDTDSEPYKNCQIATAIALKDYRKVENPTYYYAASGSNRIQTPRWVRHELVKGEKVGNHQFVNDSQKSSFRLPSWSDVAQSWSSVASSMASWFRSTRVYNWVYSTPTPSPTPEYQYNYPAGGGRSGTRR